MPIFEYSCPNCGIFECIRFRSEGDLEECPRCHEAIEKILSVPSQPIFKGNGFYKTDYCSKPDAPKNGE
jgi:putative FmdB family regulatory protein